MIKPNLYAHIVHNSCLKKDRGFDCPVTPTILKPVNVAVNSSICVQRRILYTGATVLILGQEEIIHVHPSMWHLPLTQMRKSFAEENRAVHVSEMI